MLLYTSGVYRRTICSWTSNRFLFFTYLSELMSPQRMLMIQRLQVVMPPRNDAADTGVHVENYEQRYKERPHAGKHYVAAILIVAASLVPMPVLVVPGGEINMS